MSISSELMRMGAQLRRPLHLLRHTRVRAVGHLLTGTFATALITLLTISLTARALGVFAYGLLAIVLTIGQASERLLSFQSWQPLVRYGAPLLDDEELPDLRRLLKFGLLLDIAGGSLACAVSGGLILLAHLLFSLPQPLVTGALIYLASLPFGLNGLSTALFRLGGNFRLLARVQVLNALVRLACVAAAAWAGLGLIGFVLVWAGTQVLGSALNLGFALWSMRNRGIAGFMRARLADLFVRFPDLFRFAWGSNLSLSIWATAQQLDTLLVGALVDPASAGLYYLARRIGRILQQVGSQVEAVVYPDLSRSAAKGQNRRFLKDLFQTEAILAAFGATCVIGALIFGSTFMRIAAGPNFTGAAPLLVVQIIAVSLTLSGSGARAALLSKGAQAAVLRTVATAATVFFVAAPPLILLTGAIGANIAHVLFGLVWLVGLNLSLRRVLRSDGEDRPTAPSLTPGEVR